MFRKTLLALAVCAAALYLSPGEAQAQRGRGGWGGRGGYSRGGWGGYYGRYGYGGYGRYGYGRYGYGRYGYGRYGYGGLGLYGLGYGLGYGYSPGYYAYSPYDYDYGPADSYGYAPDYGPSLDAYGPAPSTADVYPAPSYPSGPTTSSGYYSPPADESAREPGSVQIEVRVPAGAEVFFDGVKSSQTGTDRVFSTPALESGRSYRYDVTARWREGGREVERKQTVRFRGGESRPVVVDFTRAGDEREPE